MSTDKSPNKREMRPNPFGDYSFMEAQQTGQSSTGIGNNSAGNEQPLNETKAMRTIPKNSPFFNYNFQEAQRAHVKSNEQNIASPTLPTVSSAYSGQTEGSQTKNDTLNTGKTCKIDLSSTYSPDKHKVEYGKQAEDEDVVSGTGSGGGYHPLFENYNFLSAQGESSTTSEKEDKSSYPTTTFQPEGSMHFSGTEATGLKSEKTSEDEQQKQQKMQQQQQQQDDDDCATTAYGNNDSTVEQYAIRSLYEGFRDRAAAKIDSIIGLRLDREPDLPRYLDEGIDPIFDRTLDKLGVLARRHPRVIIELLLVWRKTTIDTADDGLMDMGMTSRNSLGINSTNVAAPQPGLKHQPSSFLSSTASALSRAHYVMRERKSLASVYILCRALDAVVSKLENIHLEGDLGDRLEELVFNQVRQVNPANLRRSQNRRDIQDLYARLIGRISEIRFVSMSDRFIAELERIPMVGGNNDEWVSVLIHNMRFLKLRVFPIDALEESSAFLLSCAKFYSRTSGSMKLKHAWALLLTELLMPMAAVVNVEVNLPELVQAIDIIYAKAMKMAAKVRHVTVAFPLCAATLCISRRETFHQRWLSLLEYCIQRLKDKQFRRVSMDAILRMFWVYLFRYPENTSTVTRRIDSLARIFFPATKLHAWPKTVPPEAFVYFLMCAACFNFDYAMRSLLQNMLQLDSGWPGTAREVTEPGPILDTLNPIRVGLAFQALLSVAAIRSKSDPNVASIISHPPFPGTEQLSGLDIFTLDSMNSKSSSSSSRDDTVGSVGNGSSSGNGISTENHSGSNFIFDKAYSRTGIATHRNPKRLHGAGRTGDAGSASGGPASKSGSRSGDDSIDRHIDIGINNEYMVRSLQIDTTRLPDNIRNSLGISINVVTRYINFLVPMFGHYVLADDRLLRLTRTVPPFSSVVLTGSTMSLSNTTIHSAPPNNKDHKSSSISSTIQQSAQGSASSTGALINGSSIPSMAGGDDSGERGHIHFYLESNTNKNSTSWGGTMASTMLIRQSVPRYPSERQSYVELISTYVQNVPRCNIFWEQADMKKLVEALVQNTLHVDQRLAAESRISLLDLFAHPMALSNVKASSSALSNKHHSVTETPSGSGRLFAVTQSVVRATQLLRAIDERFSDILAGGIYTLDTHSFIPFSQPGDSLVEPCGVGPWEASHNMLNSSGFWEICGHPQPCDLHGTASETNSNNIQEYSNRMYDKVGHGRYKGSCSGCDSDIDIDSAATAAAAVAAAINVTKRASKGTSHRSSHGSSITRDLNGGFLHFYLDLLSHLQMYLCEWVAAKSSTSPDTSKKSTNDGSGNNTEKQSHSKDSEPNKRTEHIQKQASSHNTVDGQDWALKHPQLIGDRQFSEWEKLINSIEANAISLLCSGNPRVRYLSINILYQAGMLRYVVDTGHILHVQVPKQRRLYGKAAYNLLNIQVAVDQHGNISDVRGHAPTLSTETSVMVSMSTDSTRSRFLMDDPWPVPFGPTEEHPQLNPNKSQQQTKQSLAKLAASPIESDNMIWVKHFPAFVRSASAQIPDVMLVARTLACQRLYQMQPLMNQYAEAVLKSTAYSGSKPLSSAAAASSSASSGLAKSHDKYAPRMDMINAFNSLFLFAVLSLPTSESTRTPGSYLSSGEMTIGSRSSSPGSGSSGTGRSRLAKSLARKLAPLKTSSRSGKQEQGIGLASVVQLVRIASPILRSENGPLRERTVAALCCIHPTYLQDLMRELRPLADSLFDDLTAGAHRHYLHVSGGSTGANSGGVAGSAIGGIDSPKNTGETEGGLNSGSPRQGILSTKNSSSAHLASQPTQRNANKRHVDFGGKITYADGKSSSEALSDSDDGVHGRQKSTGDGAGKTEVSLPNQGRRANSFDAVLSGGSDFHGRKISREIQRQGKSQHSANASSSGITENQHKSDSSALASGNTSSHNAATGQDAPSSSAVAAALGGTSSQVRRRKLRTSLAQIYKHVARQLNALDSNAQPLCHDEEIMAQLISYIRETKTFLSENTVQWEWDHHNLRIHFCGLVEALYYFISLAASSHTITQHLLNPIMQPSKAARQRFTYETRNGLYQLCERWSGVGRFSDATRDAETRIISVTLEQYKDQNERMYMSAIMEDERLALEHAALRAMAVLCRGSTASLDQSDQVDKTKQGARIGDPRERFTLFSWVSDALAQEDANVQRVAQNAIEWTIRSEPSDSTMVRMLVELCYNVSTSDAMAITDTIVTRAAHGVAGLALRDLDGPASKSAQPSPPLSPSSVLTSSMRATLGYMRALTSIVRAKDLPVDTAVALALVLMQLHSEQRAIRCQALLMLRAICANDPRKECVDGIDELCYSIVSDVPAIAKKASQRLARYVARAYCEYTVDVVREIAVQIHAQNSSSSRLGILLSAMQPWVYNIKLLGADNEWCSNDIELYPAAVDRDSLVVLQCLLYASVKAGTAHIGSMQMLWLALVAAHPDDSESGPEPAGIANARLVMQHMTGLLLQFKSPMALRLIRRILVAILRSECGELVLARCFEEVAKPDAFVPMNDELIDFQSAPDDEPWVGELASSLDQATGEPGCGYSTMVVSTGGLAMYYLSTSSYSDDVPRSLGSDRRWRTAVPIAVFALAYPEGWVRESARVLLENIAASRTSFFEFSSVGTQPPSHTILSVLHSEECLSGFGGVDELSEHHPSAGRSPTQPAQTSAESVYDMLDRELQIAATSWNTHDLHNIISTSSVQNPQQLEARPHSPVLRAQEVLAGGSALQVLVIGFWSMFRVHCEDIAQTWAHTAVRWGMCCPIRPLAALALKAFGVLAAEAQVTAELAVRPTRTMVLQLVDRLSNVAGGSPSQDMARFSGTVLDALAETAALAVHSSDGETAMLLDLAATSLALMLSAQASATYATALRMFEQVFAALEARVAFDAEFFGEISGRAGIEITAFRPALLRGIQFTQCRARCLAFLRDTATRAGCSDSEDASPMLALVAQMPALIDDALHQPDEPATTTPSTLWLAFGGAEQPTHSAAITLSSGPSRLSLFRMHTHKNDAPTVQEPVADDGQPTPVDQPDAGAATHAKARYAALIEHTAKRIEGSGGQAQRETRKLLNDTAALFDSPGRAHAIVRQFGFALAERMHGPAAGEALVVLISHARPSTRARTALGYLSDDQMAHILRGTSGPQPAGSARVYGELRRMHIALQLVQSVLASEPGRRIRMRVARAAVPVFKAVFDLAVCARPMSDAASRVMQSLLLRFDDGSLAVAETDVGWFETDANVLAQEARAALARIVAFGVGQEEVLDEAVAEEADLIAQLDEFDRALDEALLS